jgi:hypothetical protein
MSATSEILLPPEFQPMLLDTTNCDGVGGTARVGGTAGTYGKHTVEYTGTGPDDIGM